MQYKPNYPIYLQIADYLCEQVLTGRWRDGDKLPSVKELSVLGCVNPNTVIKALTWLQDQEVLTTQRGIGYFLTGDARRKTLQLKRRQFIEEDLPQVFANMRLLGIDMDELRILRQDWAGSHNQRHSP